MFRCRGAARSIVALAAAYTLALHAIVAGLTLGAAPTAASFDPSHALCSPESSDAGVPSKAPAHAHEVACCLAQAAGGALPPPLGAVVRALVPGPVSVTWRPTSTEPHGPSSFSPVGARAPPRLV
jgi:hypothetical protein